MSNRLSLREGQKHVYKVEILRVFDGPEYRPGYWQRTGPSPDRVRRDEPALIEIGWYDTAGAARNYGSNRTGRSAWYNGNTGWNYERKLPEVLDPNVPAWQQYTYERVEYDTRGHEPSLDYRVYKVPVTLDMGDAVLLPPLKKLSE